MIKNNKGAALMQVLLITIILAGIATMLLRATLSRTTSARKTRRAASSQVLIQACMAEVNTLWSKKTPEAFRRDLKGAVSGANAGQPFMYCKTVNAATDRCTDGEYKYVCSVANPYNSSNPYEVTAEFVKDDSSRWVLAYEVTKGSDNL